MLRNSSKFIPAWLLPSLLLICLTICPTLVTSLSCYICAEGNLDEFGECGNPFQFDCENYERRYPNERIFCRTTRHKAVNSTYTIVKECISESAHHSNFPKKNNGLEEECDVIEVDGFEVAYCLCRTADYCNGKYPEFFEPEPDMVTPPGGANGKVGEDHSKGMGTGRESRAEKEHGLNQHPVPSDSSTEGIRQSPASFISATEEPDSQEGLASHLFGSSKEGKLISIGQLPSPTSPPTGTPITPILTCAQCSQTNLPNLDADCAPQVIVPCEDRRKKLPDVGRALCFTRQIVTPRGLYGVEKMCVTEQAVLEEFGSDATLNGCKVVDSEGVTSRYCVCDGPQCNRASVDTQMRFIGQPTAALNRSRAASGVPSLAGGEESSHTTSTTVPTRATATPDSGMQCAACLDVELRSSLADCRQMTLLNCAEQLPKGEKAFCLTRQTQNGKGAYIVEKKCIGKSGFAEHFPNEPLKPHCASTYDGYVNFCLCDSGMCNKAALPQQAEEFSRQGGTKLTKPPSTTTATSPQQDRDIASFGSEAPSVPDMERETTLGHMGSGHENGDGAYQEKTKEPSHRPSLQRTRTVDTSDNYSTTTATPSVKDRLERWKAGSTYTMAAAAGPKLISSAITAAVVILSCIFPIGSFPIKLALN